MRVDLAFPIKTYDIDFAGHVSNITYIRWLEDLRLEILRRSLPLGTLMARSQTPILLRTEIDYLAQARLPQTVTGQMWVSASSRARATLTAEFTIAETGELSARAHQVICLVDTRRGRPIALPEELQQAMGEDW